MELRKTNRVLEVVPRDVWGALPPKSSDPVVQPISYVFYSSTKSNECLTQDECVKELASMQKTDMKKTDDIKYNFLVSGNGTVYEGRGWMYKPKLPVGYRDCRYTSLHIGFIGTFDAAPPSKIMFEIKNAIIKSGMENNYIEKQILEFDLENLTRVETK